MKRLTWSELLSSAAWATITSGTERSLETFAYWRAPKGVATRIVRGDRCQTEVELFAEWAAALQFPLDGCRNWNAFDDCVGDLDWLQSKTVVVFVARADALLAQQSVDFEVEMLIDILRRAVIDPLREWRDGQPTQARSLRFVFHSKDAELIQVRLSGSGEDPRVWRFSTRVEH